MNETPGNQGSVSTAVLNERLGNLMKVVQEIKNGMSELATRKEIADLVSRAEHSAVVVSLENRIARLESSTPGKLLDTVVKLCLALSAIAGAVAVIIHFSKVVSP